MNSAKINVPFVQNFDDLARRGVEISIGHAPWAKDYPYVPSVHAYLAHNGSALGVHFVVCEDHIRAVTLDANGPVWEDSCVEVFLGAADGLHYFNFETSCIGTPLAAKRLSREKAETLPAEQIASLQHRSSLPHATIDLRAQTTWTLSLQIPFSLLGYNSTPQALRANFYKCGDKTDKPHFLCWSPIDLPSPDFHCPQFFGTLILE